MEKLVIVFLVLGVTALLAGAARQETGPAGDERSVYRYSAVISRVSAGGAIFFILFMPWAYFAHRLRGIGDVLVLGGFALLGCLLWLFYSRTRIYLTADAIFKVTPFWQTKIFYDEVRKIIIFRSRGNPGAAMTRVYGKRKITLEAMLVGYQQLIEELRLRCKQAQVIEK